MTSAAFSSAINASSSVTLAACSGVRLSAGVKRAPSALSSSAGCGVRDRSRTVRVAFEWVACSRSTIEAARRVDWEFSARALEFSCRMFTVAPKGVGWDAVNLGVPESNRKSVEWITLFHLRDSGADDEPGAERPDAFCPRGRRRQLQPRGRTGRLAQIDGVAAHRGAGRTARRAPAPAHDPQADG